MNIEIAAIIAVVLIVALALARRVGFSLNKEGVKLSADKNKDRDTVSAKSVEQSRVDITTRPGQDIHVEDIKDHSNVKIR